MEKCGGDLSATTGWISSPDNDKNDKYDDSVDCWWNITAEENHVIEFSFTLLEIDESFRCMEDFIEVLNPSAVENVFYF